MKPLTMRVLFLLLSVHFIVARSLCLDEDYTGSPVACDAVATSFPDCNQSELQQVVAECNYHSSLFTILSTNTGCTGGANSCNPGDECLFANLTELTESYRLYFSEINVSAALPETEMCVHMPFYIEEVCTFLGLHRSNVAPGTLGFEFDIQDVYELILFGVLACYDEQALTFLFDESDITTLGCNPLRTLCTSGSPAPEPTESDDDSSPNTLAIGLGVGLGVVVLVVAVYAAVKAGVIGSRGTNAGYTSVNFM